MSVVKIGYFVLTFGVILVFLITYRNGLEKLNKPDKYIQKRVGILTTVLVGWCLYLYWIGESGYLWDFSMPPRFLLCIFLPLIISAALLFIINRKSGLYQVISEKRVIYFQGFRIIVELLILGTYLQGVFPVETTFEGYNYEIVVGVLAPLVAFFVYDKKRLPRYTIVIFNIVGLITLGIIIFIVITSMYFQSVWGDAIPVINAEFSRVPYLLLPGVLAPAAIFVHVFSLIQYRKAKNVKN